MRSLTPAAQALLASGTVAVSVLVHMDLAGGHVRMNTSAWTLTWGGHDWQGLGTLMRIDTIDDAPGEVRGLRFELSGVPASMLAVALAEPVQGRPVSLWTALVSTATYAVEDASLDWRGRLDVMTITERAGTAVVNVTAEHAGIDLLRPVVSLYTDREQQRLFPSDRGFEYVIDQSERPIIWPSREWFRNR